MFVASEDATSMRVKLASVLLICDPKRTKSFRHRECRTYLAIQQWNQPPPLLLSVAIAGQNL
jgi:hypothetical protein